MLEYKSEIKMKPEIWSKWVYRMSDAGLNINDYLFFNGRTIELKEENKYKLWGVMNEWSAHPLILMPILEKAINDKKKDYMIYLLRKSDIDLVKMNEGLIHLYNDGEIIGKLSGDIEWILRTGLNINELEDYFLEYI